MIRYKLLLKGTVQGVGFRPYVYRTAKGLNLKGFVLNTEEGLLIEIEGKEEDLDEFIKRIKGDPPPLSKIQRLERERLEPKGYKDFTILKSEKSKKKEALIPKDVAICEECRKDILNPSDRHYLYPFTNCTNCGPRFTIIKDIPYDRKNTTMDLFEMCEACKKEYDDPMDRRFHAQPVACPQCGPTVFIYDKERRKLEGDWLQNIHELLKRGYIIGIKGIGGFHIACDAKNPSTVKKLRERKGRDAKPFAVMMRDLNVVKEYCFINEIEESLLLSKEAPIVILRKKKSLPYEIAPNLKTIGVMLPYSPLHYLILSGPLDVLVMTSGNYTDQPIIKDDEEAFEKLTGIVDYLCIHERGIENRCDDSVLQVIGKEIQIIRRSRGFVPEPLQVKRKGKKNILGIGGEMKNNFCILKEDQAFLSQYIGDIDTVEGEENLERAIKTFKRLLGIEIEIIAFDAHPYYASSALAKRLSCERYFSVFHHHAHLVSAMAENGLDGEVIGMILDGTGYGRDGKLWGFEILTGNYEDFQREFHLAYVPLPGGEKAIKEPWRVAISYLLHFLKEKGREYAERLFGKEKVALIEKMVENNLNSPLSSGCGRLFDAVSSIIHLCHKNTYEGQAAVELSELLRGKRGIEDSYGYEIRDNVILPSMILEGVVEDYLSNLPKVKISAKFHNTIVRILLDVAERIREKKGLTRVVLSGGTWQNPYLFEKTIKGLSSSGFEVFFNRFVPINDGGIGLGQAMICDRLCV